MQQQYPDQYLRMSAPERELVISRLNIIRMAKDSVMSASDHPVPDNHFPRKQHDIVLNSQISQQEAIDAYTDNVNRNLYPQTVKAVDDALTIEVEPVAKWQTESMLSARQQVDNAHQNFPIPQELIDA